MGAIVPERLVNQKSYSLLVRETVSYNTKFAISDSEPAMLNFSGGGILPGLMMKLNHVCNHHWPILSHVSYLPYCSRQEMTARSHFHDNLAPHSCNAMRHKHGNVKFHLVTRPRQAADNRDRLCMRMKSFQFNCLTMHRLEEY